MTDAYKAQSAQPNADDFYAQYGPLAAPLREALGFSGQNDIDMFAPSRVDPNGGSDGGQAAYMKPSAGLQAMIDAGQVEYGNMQNHDPTAQDGMGYWVNWDKMPKTALGSGGTTGLSGYDPSLDKIMFNSRAKVNDPNFGWITPTANLDVNKPGFDETFYNVAPSLFTMGMGGMIAAAAPALAGGAAASGVGGMTEAQLGQLMMKIPDIARGLGNGHGFNPMMLANLVRQYGMGGGGP